MDRMYDRLDDAVQNWWVSLLVGILFVVISLWLMFSPIVSYIALSILFSVLMFVSGIMEIVFAASNRRRIQSWGWYLAGGILDLVLGILLLVIPGLSMEVLPFILAFWLMFRGITAVGYALDLHRYGTRNWGWYLAFGLLAILIAFAILWQPSIGAFTLVYLVAYSLFVIGVFRIMLSFELRGLHKRGGGSVPIERE